MDVVRWLEVSDGYFGDKRMTRDEEASTAARVEIDRLRRRVSFNGSNRFSLCFVQSTQHVAARTLMKNIRNKTLHVTLYAESFARRLNRWHRGGVYGRGERRQKEKKKKKKKGKRKRFCAFSANLRLSACRQVQKCGSKGFDSIGELEGEAVCI